MATMQTHSTTKSAKPVYLSPGARAIYDLLGVRKTLTPAEIVAAFQWCTNTDTSNCNRAYPFLKELRRHGLVVKQRIGDSHLTQYKRVK